MASSFYKQDVDHDAFTPRLFLPVLAAILLLLMTGGRSVLAETSLNGSVRGRWTRVMAPIHIVGDVSIAEHDTLMIEPGVQIWFEGNFAFEIGGVLLAVGEDEQQGRISFSGRTQWRGIYFNETADPASQLMACDITNAWIGVEVDQASVTIQRCRIDAYSIAVNCLNSSSNIWYNIRIRARADNTQAGDARAISIFGDSAPVIKGNDLIEARAGNRGDAYGLWIVQASPIIEGNWIEASSNQAAIAIFTRGSDKTRIIRNIIRTSTSGMMRGIWLVYSSAVDIISNDILLLTTSNNAIGLMVDVGSIATIMNNIVLGNYFSVGDSSVDSSVSTLSDYNNYFQHVTNHSGAWQGGDHEISADPQFESSGMDINAGYYHISFDSPCRDAGSPDIEDPDDRYHTRSDIGRHPHVYDPNPHSVPADPAPIAYGIILHPAYPNPFNRTTRISFELASPGPASVAVFDLSGRLIKTLWDSPVGSGTHSLEWSAGGIAAGEYLIRLDAVDRSQTTRVLFLP